MNFENIKNKIKSYIKDTYIKFSITYFAFLFGIYFFISSDFFATFKTVTAISLFFYLLYFLFYCLDKNNVEKETTIKKGKVEKRSWLGKILYSSKFKFKENERERLTRALKDKISKSKARNKA